MAQVKSHHRQPRTTAKPKPKRGTPKSVACLAAEVPDHDFESSDPANERYCSACRARLRSNPTEEHVYGWPFGTGLA